MPAASWLALLELRKTQPGSHGARLGHGGRSLGRQGHTGRGRDENDEQHCIL